MAVRRSGAKLMPGCAKSICAKRMFGDDKQWLKLIYIMSQDTESATSQSLYASLFLQKTFEVNGLKYDRLNQNSGNIVYRLFPHSFRKPKQATTISYTYVLDR